MRMLSFSSFYCFLLIISYSLLLQITESKTIECNNSLQKCVSDASAGDTVKLNAGTFSEKITVEKSLTLLGNNNVDPNFNNRPSSEESVVHQIMVDPGFDAVEFNLKGLTLGSTTLPSLEIDSFFDNAKLYIENVIFTEGSTYGTFITGNMDKLNNTFQSCLFQATGNRELLDFSPGGGEVNFFDNVFDTPKEIQITIGSLNNLRIKRNIGTESDKLTLNLEFSGGFLIFEENEFELMYTLELEGGQNSELIMRDNKMNCTDSPNFGASTVYSENNVFFNECPEFSASSSLESSKDTFNCSNSIYIQGEAPEFNFYDSSFHGATLYSYERDRPVILHSPLEISSTSSFLVSGNFELHNSYIVDPSWSLGIVKVHHVNNTLIAASNVFSIVTDSTLENCCVASTDLEAIEVSNVWFGHSTGPRFSGSSNRFGVRYEDVPFASEPLRDDCAQLHKIHKPERKTLEYYPGETISIQVDCVAPEKPICQVEPEAQLVNKDNRDYPFDTTQTGSDIDIHIAANTRVKGDLRIKVNPKNEGYYVYSVSEYEITLLQPYVDVGVFQDLISPGYYTPAGEMLHINLERNDDIPEEYSLNFTLTNNCDEDPVWLGERSFDSKQAQTELLIPQVAPKCDSYIEASFESVSFRSSNFPVIEIQSVTISDLRDDEWLNPEMAIINFEMPTIRTFDAELSLYNAQDNSMVYSRETIRGSNNEIITYPKSRAGQNFDSTVQYYFQVYLNGIDIPYNTTSFFFDDKSITILDSSLSKQKEEVYVSWKVSGELGDINVTLHQDDEILESIVISDTKSNATLSGSNISWEKEALIQVQSVLYSSVKNSTELQFRVMEELSILPSSHFINPNKNATVKTQNLNFQPIDIIEYFLIQERNGVNTSSLISELSADVAEFQFTLPSELSLENRFFVLAEFTPLSLSSLSDPFSVGLVQNIKLFGLQDDNWISKEERLSISFESNMINEKAEIHFVSTDLEQMLTSKLISDGITDVEVNLTTIEGNVPVNGRIEVRPKNLEGYSVFSEQFLLIDLREAELQLEITEGIHGEYRYTERTDTITVESSVSKLGITAPFLFELIDCNNKKQSLGSKPMSDTHTFTFNIPDDSSECMSTIQASFEQVVASTQSFEIAVFESVAVTDRRDDSWLSVNDNVILKTSTGDLHEFVAHISLIEVQTLNKIKEWDRVVEKDETSVSLESINYNSQTQYSFSVKFENGIKSVQSEQFYVDDKSINIQSISFDQFVQQFTVKWESQGYLGDLFIVLEQQNLIFNHSHANEGSATLSLSDQVMWNEAASVSITSQSFNSVSDTKETKILEKELKSISTKIVNPYNILEPEADVMVNVNHVNMENGDTIDCNLIHETPENGNTSTLVQVLGADQRQFRLQPPGSSATLDSRFMIQCEFRTLFAISEPFKIGVVNNIDIPEMQTGEWVDPFNVDRVEFDSNLQEMEVSIYFNPSSLESAEIQSTWSSHDMENRMPLDNYFLTSVTINSTRTSVSVHFSSLNLSLPEEGRILVHPTVFNDAYHYQGDLFQLDNKALFNMDLEMNQNTNILSIFYESRGNISKVNLEGYHVKGDEMLLTRENLDNTGSLEVDITPYTNNIQPNDQYRVTIVSTNYPSVSVKNEIILVDGEVSVSGASNPNENSIIGWQIIMFYSLILLGIHYF